MEQRGALADLRVLTLEHFISAPYCTLLLADLGAEVIKIEPPGSGDPRRHYVPLQRRDGMEMSSGFLPYNRGKRSLSLNLKTEAGRVVFLDLVRTADVVVENLRPGLMDAFGLGYETLRQANPRLVYAAISGFGRLPGYEGPYSNRPAFDAAIQAMGGLASLIGSAGGPPTLAPYGFSDIYTGVLSTVGILAAVHERERIGRGQFVDASMYDAVVGLIERALSSYLLNNVAPQRGVDPYGPIGTFRAGDGGYLAIVIPTDEMWRRTCEAIGRPDLLSDPDLATSPDRARHWHDRIVPALEAWASTLTRDEAARRLSAAGQPAGMVQTVEEIVRCPQVAARNLLIEVDDPVWGTVSLPRTGPKLENEPPRSRASAPQLGEHTEDVLRRLLNYDDARIETLRSLGAI